MLKARNRLIFVLVLCGLSAQNPSHAGWLEQGFKLFQNCRSYLETGSSQAATANSLMRRFQSDKSLKHSLTLLAQGAQEARKAESFIDQILTLPAWERQKFLSQLALDTSAQTLKQPLLTLILRLALHDEEAWNRLLELEKDGPRAHHHFVPHVALLGRILTSLFQTSPHRIAHFARLIPRNYRSQNTPGSIKEKYLRRIYDFILKLQYPAAPFFADALASGLSPQAAYKQYIEWVNTYFMEPERISYSGESVLQAANQIQFWLRNLAPPENALQLTLFGSFPNGKADLTRSDIDLDFTVVGAYPKTLNDTLRKQLPTWEEPLLAEIQKLFQSPSSLKLSFVQLKDELTFPGIINSVAFRITADQIDLLVYDGNTPNVYPIREFTSSLAPEMNR